MTPILWNGKPITKPGLYAGIPMDDYHSPTICGKEPSVSSSMLRKLFLRSPAHYWAHSPYNPEGKADEVEETEALIVGRAAHHILLGEEFFAERYIIRPKKLQGDDGLKPWNGNRDACKDWLLNHVHLTVLSPDQAEQIRGMALALGRYPLVVEGILNGYVECSMFWRDPATGIWLKARPDVIPTDCGTYADLKKTRCTEYFELQAALDNYGLYMQAALIFEGAKQLKMPTEAFVLLFIENDYPHDIRDATLKDKDIALGTEVNVAMLDKFARCWRSGQWPGTANDILGGTIELSERTRERIKRRLEFEKTDAAFLSGATANIIPWRSQLKGRRGDGFAGSATVDSALRAAGVEINTKRKARRVVRK